MNDWQWRADQLEVRIEKLERLTLELTERVNDVHEALKTTVDGLVTYCQQMGKRLGKR